MQEFAEADAAAAYLQQLSETHQHMVFFGGAGVSRASGIPDFRSQDGLYKQTWDWPPEEILSHSFYEKHPHEFWRFYRQKMLYLDAKPNACHKKLAAWEAQGVLMSVVTQNIDGLHQAAGSRSVWELHGSVHRNYCEKCGAAYDARWISEQEDIPLCEKCGGRVKPDVVLYEEGLDEDVLTGALMAISNADALIIGGTSLVVYPAAGLVQYFQGDTIVVCDTNRDLGKRADLLISCDIEAAFS